MMPNEEAVNAIIDDIVASVSTIGEHETFNTVSIPFEGTLQKRKDVYEGPNGQGCSLVFNYQDGNEQLWFREVNVIGNEEWRTNDWQEFEGL